MITATASTKNIIFDGSDYVPNIDQSRLSSQLLAIRKLMMDGRWRTLDEIAHLTNYPQASISAQLRHLRKERFGRYRVEKRRRGDHSNGLWEYKVSRPLISSDATGQMLFV